jgi:tetratricopeptide (TPR) repeat protein
MTDASNIFPPPCWVDGRFTLKGLVASLTEGGEVLRLWRERPRLTAQALSGIAAVEAAMTVDDPTIILKTSLLIGLEGLPPAHRRIARGVRGRARLRCGHNAGALDDFSRILDETPGDQAALINRSAAAIELRDYQSAIADLSRVIARADSAAARLWRAKALGESGEVAAARADLKRAQQLEPADLWALRFRAAYATAGDTDPQTSLEELDAAIAGLPADSDTVHLHRRKARVLAGLGRTAEAAAGLDIALDVVPEDGRRAILIERAELLAEAGELVGALADYDRALALGEADSTHQAARIRLLIKLGRYDEALARADAYVAADEHRLPARLVRAELAKLMGDFDLAEADLRVCHEQWFWDRQTALDLAELIEARGDLEAALAVIARLGVWNHDPGLCRRAGRLNQRLGRTAEAIVQFDRLIAVAPRDADALRERAALNAQLGRLAAARADLAAAAAIEGSAGDPS